MSLFKKNDVNILKKLSADIIRVGIVPDFFARTVGYNCFFPHQALNVFVKVFTDHNSAIQVIKQSLIYLYGVYVIL